MSEWVPTIEAMMAWRTFPSDYEWELLQQWLRGFLDTPSDYEARLALNVLAQRLYLSGLLVGDFADVGGGP